MGNDEIARLNFMQWHEGLDHEKPYQLVSEDLPDLYGIPRQNFEIQPGPPTPIVNIRGREGDFDLDKNGFAHARHEFPTIDFLDEHQIETKYMPEVEQILRSNVEGVDEVCFFQWRVRANRRTATVSKLGNIRSATDVLVPAHFVHLDQSLKAAIEYVQEHRGERADYLLRGRVRIINVWKPIDHPVYDCPLALCDGSTVSPNDLILCDNITKAKQGELVLPLYNESSKWYYLRHQTPEEVTIMKIIDSDTNAEAPCCPHCAFDHCDFDLDTPPRRSIEMRALVFTYPSPANKGWMSRPHSFTP